MRLIPDELNHCCAVVLCVWYTVYLSDCLVSVDCRYTFLSPASNPAQVIFTYDVEWQLDSDTTWSRRWEAYLKGNPDVRFFVFLYVTGSVTVTVTIVIYAVTIVIYAVSVAVTIVIVTVLLRILFTVKTSLLLLPILYSYHFHSYLPRRHHCCLDRYRYIPSPVMIPLKYRHR